MSYQSSAWSLNEVMQDCTSRSTVSRAMSARYTEVHTTFEYDQGIRGSIRTMSMPQMELSHFELQSNSDVVTTLTDGVDRCTCTFLCQGTINSQFKDHDTALKQESFHHSFVHLNTDDSAHRIQAGYTSIIILNINPSALADLIPDWHERHEVLYNVKGRKEFWVSPSLALKRSQSLTETLSALRQHSFTGGTKSLYLEAKALELLALQLHELSVLGKSSSGISKADKEKLMALREYIDLHYLDPLSLHSLCRQFLINEFKVKKGFKELFHETTFGYINNLRMEKAKSLLQDRVMTVNEVSDYIGYSSVQNFSNAFYKKYSYRPSMLTGSC